MEEVVNNLEKDINEWNNLRQQDLTPLVEAELECLVEQMKNNFLEMSQEVEVVSRDLKSLEAREVEAIECNVISSEALDFARDQIKRAREIIAKANLLLSKAEPECQAEIIRLEKTKVERM